MLLKNQCLFGPFAGSFAKLMDIKTLPLVTKYELVKLKKEMIENAEAIQAMTKVEGSKQEVAELLGILEEYAFKQMDVKLVGEELSAADIFNLEPLFEENL